ncbi:MAG: phosphoadenylyl-sulfate reductase [Candidatus Omnitrophica bacterium]|nr:phosphoadenylyl-sulfate reductase [Candidatus Omnitrophota bacterium]
MNSLQKIEKLNNQTKGLTPEAIIRLAQKEFGKRLTFASSLGEEDQVITHMISLTAPQIGIFTLDTGRLFPETYELMAKIQKRYSMPFKIYFPDAKAVERMVFEKGINLFYESVENRKSCCGIRKVEPLQRALKNVDAWISGLRRDQSITRSDVKIFEWDATNKKVKINPLADWTLVEVREYIGTNKVDVNPLHEKGFISIGCAPCTRAIKSGEDIRAGRWWWEQPEQKECGLHNNPRRPPQAK